MTFLGKFASASVAAITLCASTPALAGSDPRPIHVLCDGDSFPPLCAALGDAVKDMHNDHPVIVNPTSVTQVLPYLTIRFESTRQSDHALAGFLSWRDGSGRSGNGPEIELSAVDARINSDMLTNFVRALVRHSDLPL